MTRALLVVAGALVAVPPPASPAPAGAVVRVEHRAPTALPSRGPSNAPVTIELFFTPGLNSRNFEYQALETLQAAHPSKIRLVYRIVSTISNRRLPYAALEAFAEGKFFELMDRLNCSRMPCRIRSALTDKELVELGVSIGMDPDRLAAAMSSPPSDYDRVLVANDRRLKSFGQRRAGTLALFNGRPPQTGTTMRTPDLEREYEAARIRAEDALDRGAAPENLVTALDDRGQPTAAELTPQTGATDDELFDPPAEPPLATPPLRLAGLPSYGPRDATVTIVVLCSPMSDKCSAPRNAARGIQDTYPDSVRVVWAPFFDASREDAADLGLLGDAVLCAEQVGTIASDDLTEPSSGGWRWMEAMFAEVTSRRRLGSAGELIDKLATRLKVEPRAFASCRAKRAGSTLSWAQDARHSGVRTTPATVVGGRLYGPITDPAQLLPLVQAELAPGWLGESAPTWRRRL